MKSNRQFNFRLLFCLRLGISATSPIAVSEVHFGFSSVLVIDESPSISLLTNTWTESKNMNILGVQFIYQGGSA